MTYQEEIQEIVDRIRNSGDQTKINMLNLLLSEVEMNQDKLKLDIVEVVKKIIIK